MGGGLFLWLDRSGSAVSVTHLSELSLSLDGNTSSRPAWNVTTCRSNARRGVHASDIRRLQRTTRLRSSAVTLPKENQESDNSCPSTHKNMSLDIIPFSPTIVRQPQVFPKRDLALAAGLKDKLVAKAFKVGLYKSNHS